MILSENNIQIDFRGAINGIKFDEDQKTNPNFHGLSHCMKAVDFIVEMDDSYLFVEVKDFTLASDPIDNDKKTSLINSLVGKYRDSFLYRWAEEKADKPVKYLCLLEMDNALISSTMTELQRKLPRSGPNTRWKKPLAQTCIVANIDRWNENFPDWPVSRLESEGDA